MNEVLPKNFKDPVQKCELQLDGYTLFSNISQKQKHDNLRGIAMYVKKSLNAQQVETLDDGTCESVWCELQLKDNDKLLIGTVYRSPSSSKENNSKLNNEIREMTKNRSHVLIVGDFNHREIDWSEISSTAGEKHEATMFLETIRDSFLCQHVTQTTHHRLNSTATLIDLIFTNEENMVVNLEHKAPLGKSCHNILTFEYICYRNNQKTLPQSRFAYDKGSYAEMRTKLNEINVSQHIEAMDVQQAWDYFSTTIELLANEYIPKVKKGQSDRRKPLWLDDKALSKVRKKHESFRRYMETREGKDYQEYAKARNQAKAACRKSVKEYEKQIAKQAKKNPKLFYSYAKKKMKTTEGISDLKDGNDNKATTDKSKAEMLNKFFCSVFTQEDTSSIPNCEKQKVINHLTDIEVTETMVLKLLKSLDTSKSPGPDGMHPRILYELAEHLAKPLSIIFTLSLQEAKLPTQWKDANVTPLFKKGEKSKPSNYRPVSLTSIPCKMLEKIIRSAIFSHLEENKLISECQHGFIHKRSCTTNLLTTLDDWTDMLEKDVPVDAIYLDFAKAFDSVPHERLLTKLEAYGINGQIGLWTRDFLTQRRQRVKINGSYSEWASVSSGVPQGSVLGPVLFVIYINDMPDVTKNTCSMYADDTKLYGPATDTIECETLQRDLNSLVNWSSTWQLRFNEDKCKVLQMGHKNKGYKYNMKSRDNTTVELQSTEMERDLGIIIDKSLKFSNQVETQVNKANKILGLIRRSYEYIDNEAMKLLFTALVRPHLEFGITVWSPRYNKDKTLIENVLRRATRCIPGMKELSYMERLEKIKLPSMSYRRIRGDLIEVYKYMNGMYTSRNFFKLNPNNTRGHNLKLQKEHSQSGPRNNFFPNRVLDTWNKLKPETVNAKTLNGFKNAVDREFHEYIHKDSLNHPLVSSTRHVKSNA